MAKYKKNNGKGSKRRPSSVPASVFRDNYDRIFKKSKK